MYPNKKHTVFSSNQWVGFYISDIFYLNMNML